MISFKQLSYALAVEKHLHFKKAAEACNISQSALSTALSELERQLELQIFERDNKKVLVTPIGREVLKRASKIKLEVEDLEQLAYSNKTPLSFPMTVGIIPTIAPYLLPKMFPLLLDEYPHSNISLLEEQSAPLVEMVRQGEIDTAVIALPYPCEGLLTLEFWHEDFYWITLKGNKHSHQKQVNASTIGKSQLMLLNEGHCLKEHVLDVCKLSSPIKSKLGATSLSTLIQMVQANLGTTIIPEMAKEQLINENDHLAAIHLNEKSPHRRLAFVLRPNYTRLSSIEILAKLCKDALKNTIQ
ncbi:MAG: LysR substrate-binding domain-containing protein [Kangiellaceae bacterium]|jgi:LysR family hydrogen peroxide-inducible transcriptional activator